ncbi:3-dehydroquinate synthase [Flavobacterium terrae]|uniref:3-dehydroquinate synthase n=1 Tax=Flavobacterium terrae TaxID=415425 RepID=A0A1M6GYX2_9FLAO|nr:3-dehydroquinate synthase [Flavobacterium terrae]SHJ15161.1 3-dehydroquinate synthase [Flavobacterium terrae]
MKSIQANNYTIHINKESYTYLNNYLKENNFSKIFFIADENTNELCLPKILPLIETEVPFEIIELEAGEENKTIETCTQVWKVLIELGADRKSLIINIGGGVITDMGGFIASTYKRGIPFINIPTTLLSMVDASVGGKNGVDLDGLKNQIGTITNPAMVIIDSTFLETLSQREMKSGLAEMLKHGLIAKKTHWEKFKELAEIDFDSFDELIAESVEIKNNIVTQDPTENGIRKALNFGHTLGHAIETLFLENPEKENLLHGEAIAAGMILESYISLKKGLISNEEYSEIKSYLLSIYEPITFEENDKFDIINLLIHDKKNEYGKVQFALLNGIGNISLNQTTDNELIMNSFKDYNG